ncbi:MAG: DUF362 domain-containing protein [Treponema sp.]|jgi:uncharacterized Fe-S center protein|nr:DUF362 domain-containing protein [Treponema sp.]
MRFATKFPAQRKKIVLVLSAAILCLAALNFQSCFSQKAGAQPVAYETSHLDELTPGAERPVVYMTTSITPAGLQAVYEALGLKANGKVAVKIHTGEPGNPNYLKPALIGDFVKGINGTIVECNAVAGGRAATAAHYQVAKSHGFTSIAPVVLLDEKGELSLPVSGGKHLKENFVGSRLTEFDFQVVLSHFKGHAMGGFGGAIKNTSIGYASSAGKSWIHSAGKSRNTGFRSSDQNAFLESMAEAAKSVADRYPRRMLYINVMNHLSVDCDCISRPAAPTMKDIGILASLDPVALDQACVDLVFKAADGKDVVKRIESRNGLLTLEHAQKIGLGSKSYELKRIDD